MNFLILPYLTYCPYCNSSYLGLASGAVSQVGKNKVLQRKKITALPNEWPNIPLYNLRDCLSLKCKNTLADFLLNECYPIILANVCVLSPYPVCCVFRPANAHLKIMNYWLHAHARLMQKNNQKQQNSK